MPNRGAVRGPRMLKEWNQLLAQALVFSADSTLLGPSLAFGNPATVLRMIGEYVICPRVAVAAADSAVVSVGIGVISTDAFDAGAGSVPDPGEEPEYPWLYWARHPLFFAQTTTDPSVAAGSVRHTFDVRSMRKMKPRESLVFIGQYGNIAGDPPLTLTLGGVRVLIAT